MSYFPCDEDVELDDMESGVGCDDAGNDSAYYIGRNEIDRAAMEAAIATYLDTGNCTLQDWAFVGTKRFKRLGFDAEGSFYDSNKAENTSIYTHVLKSLFKGKSPEQTKSIMKMISECGGLVVVVFTANCQARVFGIEWNAKAKRFDLYLEGMKVGAHQDTHGQFGQDGPAKDEFDLMGRSRCPALWWKDGDEAQFKQDYT